MIVPAPADCRAIALPPGLPDAEGLRMVPLGGLGEVGMNMMVYEYGDEMIAIDCGVLFPDTRSAGVELMYPRFDYVTHNRGRFKALVCTHGHEDHIGAVPWLLRECPVPIYAPPYALELIRARLKEHGMADNATLIPFGRDDLIRFNRFYLRPIQVNHSIVETYALALATPEGVVIHTADFRIDPTPVDNSIFDADAFRAWGNRGVLTLVSDSTNAEVEGSSVSESVIREHLDRRFARVAGRLFVTLFASSIPRVATLIALAEKYGRKVLPMGRSMKAHLDIARSLGHIRPHHDTIIDESQAESVPDDKLCVLLTGSQGEPRAALARLANDHIRHMRIRKGDTFLFSARQIPGNERSIGALINELYRREAEVILHSWRDPVHTTGHAMRDEQREMIRLCRPRFFVPMHGELRQLVNHARLAVEQGMPEDRVKVIEDGTPLLFRDGHAFREPAVEFGRCYVGADRDPDAIDAATLQARTQLFFSGVVVCVVTVDSESGEILSGPDVHQQGAMAEDHFELWRTRLTHTARQIVEEFDLEEFENPQAADELADTIRVALRRQMKRHFDVKPNVIVNVALI